MTTPGAVHEAEQQLQTILKAFVIGTRVQDCCERFVGAGRVGSFVGATGETRRNEARSGAGAAARTARGWGYGEIEAKDKDAQRAVGGTWRSPA